MSKQPAVSWQEGCLTLHIVVQTRASRDELVELNEQGLKVRITAPPVDGKANKHLIKFLAKTFQIAPSQIQLRSGEKSRHKCLVIENPQTIPALLNI